MSSSPQDYLKSFLDNSIKAMRNPSGLRLMLMGIVAVSVVFLLHIFPSPTNMILMRKVSDFAHIPLFGAFSLFLLWASIQLLHPWILKREYHYMVALGAVVVFGSASEFLQFLGPRDADVKDIVHDIIGACCALGFFATFDPAFVNRTPLNRKFWRTALRTITVATIIGFSIPVLIWAEGYRQRANNVPALCRFNTYWETLFLETRGSTFQLVSPPSAWKKNKGEKVGKLTFLRTQYPGISLLEPYPDWSPYTALRFTVFSELKQPTTLHIRIEDIHHNNRYKDRYNNAFSIKPGENIIRIPLIDIRTAPTTREMDMTAMWDITLFVHKSRHPYTLYFDEMVLEGQDPQPSTGL